MCRSPSGALGSSLGMPLDQDEIQCPPLKQQWPAAIRSEQADLATPSREQSPSAPVRTIGDAIPGLGSTLKLRISMLITLVLVLVTVAGGAYVVHKARDDIRAEVQSTLNLTDHFLDAQLTVLQDRWSERGFAVPLFQLRELQDIRHLSVKFYDQRGRLLDSNEDTAGRTPSAPRWFSSMIRATSPPMQSQVRVVAFNNVPIGRLIIAPDPTYEMDEIWSTSSGLLELLLLFFVLVNGLVWWAVSRAMQPVDYILHALDEIRRGNLATRLPPFGLPEMSRISVGFNHMVETLDRSIAENQRLTRRLLQTQETERQNLARELHDEIGQCVSAIHADAAVIRNRGAEAVRDSAQAIVAVTEHLKEIVRSMLQRLRPPDLEGLGLTARLCELVAAFEQRNPHITCTLRTSGELANIDDEVGIAVYRVIQECLTNIMAHASARHTEIEVVQADATQTSASLNGPDPAAGRIRVSVVDDGVGFFLMSANRGFGLTGIRERARALGGTCSIDSNPGLGTRVLVDVPLAIALEGPT
jgi:two-component system, NarL family, sensor histidine kinase UhpB